MPAPMPPRRILLLGEGDLADETDAALRAADAAVERLEEPSADELRAALERGADAVAVVSRAEAWPLRVALLVRDLDADVPIVATIFDPATGRELGEEIGNCTITSLAEIVAPSLAGPCIDADLAAVVDVDRPTGLRWLVRDEQKVVEGELRHVFIESGGGETSPIPESIRAQLGEYAAT